eukprot:1137735-Pelagomonas_calceolata.AAC.1
MQKHIDPWFTAFLKREIVPEGKDLCDASGIHPQMNPDEFTVVSNCWQKGALLYLPLNGGFPEYEGCGAITLPLIV